MKKTNYLKQDNTPLTHEYEAMFNLEHSEFEETLEEFRLALRKIIINILSNLEQPFSEDQVEELVADTFYRFFKQSTFNYRHDSAMFSYVKTIASRCVEKSSQFVELDEERDVTLVNDIESTEDDVALKKLYNSLNSEQVAIIEARRIGIPFKQIAKEHNKTEGQVKSIFHYAVRKLRSIVKIERLTGFEYLEGLYALEEEDIAIIKARLDGKSFKQIAINLGISSNEVFDKFQDAMCNLRGEERD